MFTLFKSKTRPAVVRYVCIRFNELGNLIDSGGGGNALWEVFTPYEVEQEVYFFPVNVVLEKVIKMVSTGPARVRMYNRIMELSKFNGVDVEIYKEKID
jgi:hypothetical protein